MEKLIEALQIFLKYGNPEYPTQCEHDVLYVHGYNVEQFSKEDVQKLEELSFVHSEGTGGFLSYKYGSC